MMILRGQTMRNQLTIPKLQSRRSQSGLNVFDPVDDDGGGDVAHPKCFDIDYGH